MCYANGLLKISKLYMMSLLQFGKYMRMIKLHNTYFLYSLFLHFFGLVYVTLPVSCCVMSVLLPCGEIKFTITKLLTDEKFKYISLVNDVYCYLCHKYG